MLMVVPSGALQLGFSDSQINALLRQSRSPMVAGTPVVTRHFSQNEEFFLRLPRAIRVGSFPVHHPLGQKRPQPELRECVRSVIAQLAEIVPNLLDGLTHLFDPASNHVPVFFRLYEIEGERFIYLARVDLTFRPSHGTRIERTSNQVTPLYETRDLFLEADLFPLESVETRRDRIVGMTIEQPIRDTWIGETGRGYMRAGMWLDRDLTKFFSRLLTPLGLQTYPYYPFSCKYRSIAHATPAVNEEERRRAVQIARRGRSFLLPHVKEIEESLRGVEMNEFSEELPDFVRLRAHSEEVLGDAWRSFSLRSYLNELDEREFELVGTLA